jgi:hypothetical protein
MNCEWDKMKRMEFCESCKCSGMSVRSIVEMGVTFSQKADCREFNVQCFNIDDFWR